MRICETTKKEIKEEVFRGQSPTKIINDLNEMFDYANIGIESESLCLETSAQYFRSMMTVQRLLLLL